MGFTAHHADMNRETRWLTPPSLVKALGEFDLDPCGAPNHVLAHHTYLLENGDDGLVDPWFGRVWLNPPYTGALPWLKRIVQHGNGIALIFARVETSLWHDWIWPNADSVLFLRSRITFLHENLEVAKANAGAPSALVAFGAQNTEALRRSGITGYLVENPELIRRRREDSENGRITGE